MGEPKPESKWAYFSIYKWLATNKTKPFGPEYCREVPTISGRWQRQACSPFCLEPSPLLQQQAFQYVPEKLISLPLWGMARGGALSMEKGLTHPLQSTGSLISSARLRSGPKEWFNPTPSTWPKIFCQTISLPTTP